MSAPRECCIAGAYGQSWPCRMAWLVAFGSGSLVELEWLDEVVACSPERQRVARRRDGVLYAYTGHDHPVAPFVALQ